MKTTNLNDTDRAYAFVRREDTTDGPFEECSCCRYPAPLHDFNSEPCKIEGGPEWCCRLCANVVKSQNDQVRAVQQTLLNIGNTILMALGAFDEPYHGATSTALHLIRVPEIAPEATERAKRLLEEVRARCSHLTDEEIEQFFDEAIAEVRAERRSAREHGNE